MSNLTGHLLDAKQMEVIGMVNMVTSSLSFLGSGSIILCSICHKKICFPEVYPLFQLSIADLLASVIFAASTILFLFKESNFPGSPGPCDYLSALMTSFYISTLFLTMAYALEALLRIRTRLGNETTNSNTSVRKPVSHVFMHTVYAFCWIFPLLIGIVLLVFTHFVDKDSHFFQNSSVPQWPILPRQCSTCLPIFHYSENGCWTLVENGSSWHVAYKVVFMTPLVLVFVINVSLYVFISKVFRQVSARRGLLSVHQHQEERSLTRKAILYQSAFLVCWLPTLVLGIASFVSDFHMGNFFWLYILQALFGPLQGFLNSFIYGWKRESFRRTLGEMSALTDSSVTSYLTL
ncbi:transmembrane protein 116-like [Gigantopelta aegis]|uniref:transmembrane protein 116-like n=1 Tax=Gigantopelta aegis TaxID=1735272 RepID=UPI001B889019|nr:transmembrane protein 116-like [Gigantopelta aegis]